MARLWSEQHRPASEAELVVSKKKVQEVREFLTLGTSGGRRLLVLKGPAGSGKAAVLRALCNDLGFEIVEWSVAVQGSARTQGHAGEASGVFREPLGDAFLRFLAQTDRYRCLQSEAPAFGSAQLCRPRVALVRDFPFTLLDNFRGGGAGKADFLERFHALIRGGAMQRAVFCFNDSRDDFHTTSRLFGPVDHAMMHTVTFDGVARTFAQRALDMVAKAEGVDPAAANIAAIAAECGGDLRHAINALQLVSESALRKGLPQPQGGRGRKGGRGLRPPTPQGGASGTSGTDDGRGAEEGGDKGLRGASLGLFHSLGRFLYCKRVPPEGLAASGGAGSQPSAKKRKRPSGEVEPRQLPPELLVPKATRPPLYFVPEEVLDASNAEPSAVVDWVFTNAPRFYGDVDDLAHFAEALADVDAWQTSVWQPGGSQSVGSSVDGLGPSVQVRALLDANLHPCPPTFADPCGGSQRDSLTQGASSFNMTRPLMRDALRHRQRRVEELNAHLEAIGPLALGSGSASTDMCIRTLPFVHLMLGYSRGTHPRLRFLPFPLMQAIKDLSDPIDNPCFVGGDGQTSERGSLSRGPGLGEATAMPAEWATALADDPIE